MKMLIEDPSLIPMVHEISVQKQWDMKLCDPC